MSGVQGCDASRFKLSSQKVTSAKPGIKPAGTNNAEALQGAQHAQSIKPQSFQPGQDLNVTKQGLSLIG
jgi:hypothetical protein